MEKDSTDERQGSRRGVDEDWRDLFEAGTFRFPHDVRLPISPHIVALYTQLLLPRIT